MKAAIVKVIRWLRPHPPISTSSRVEVDRWLLEIQRVVGSGTKSLQDVSLSAVGDDHETIVGNLCEAVKVDPSLVAASFVEFNPSQSPIDYHKLDDGLVAISMDDRMQGDRLRQVIGIAQGVAMAEWFSRTGNWPIDPIRDLRVVTMGLGGPAADAFLYDETWSALGMQGWEMSRMGTLNSLEIGYAMAAWQRLSPSTNSQSSDASPPKDLRPDARNAYRRTKKYFRYLGERETLIDRPELPTLGKQDQELRQLWSRGESTRIYASALAAKSRMDDRKEKLPAGFADAIAGLMSSPDGDLMTVATRLWGYLNIDASVAEKQIQPMLKSRYDAIFLAAVASSIDIGIPIDAFVDRLVRLSSVQSGDDFIALDLVDRSGVKSKRMVDALTQELAQAERFDDQVYADRLRQSLAVQSVV